jgi:mycothiol synthase
MNTSLLAPGLKFRPAAWADLEAVTQLIYEVCEADGDTTVAVSVDELRHEWQEPDFNLETDAFVVETDAGQIAGYESFNNRADHAWLETDGYVHPNFKGLGIGTTLLRASETRARMEMELTEPDLRVFLHSTVDNRDPASRDLHMNEGYVPARYHWRMEITLDAPPIVQPMPAGLELRPFVKGEQDVVLWQAQNEAFRDHWGSRDVTFEEWKRNRFDDPEFDPTLWMIAWDGDQVAGLSFNRLRMGIGWIRTLGVRRPWRKRGLGLALLQHSFAEFYRRGKNVIGLGVDAQNPTGATRLYQKAGMRVASEFATYEKEIRPGKEISVQSL